MRKDEFKYNSPTYETLLNGSRLGDAGAGAQLTKALHEKKETYINTALVDNTHKFSESDRDYVFKNSVEQAIRDFSFQSQCGFLSYLILLLRYGFIELAKTKAEFVASITTGASHEPSLLLRDCSQRDDNDLMGTLFTWRGEIMELAVNSGKFSERDIGIITMRLDNVPFAEVAKRSGCCLSTCKKVWKKFIAFARDILNIPGK